MNRRNFLAALAPTSPPTPTVLLDDGGWCWFQDERALIVGDNLTFGAVATGYRNPTLAGQIRTVHHNLRSGQSTIATLHTPGADENPLQWIDDHNAPAFLHRPDGRILAVYSRHGTRNEIHYRISSNKNSAAQWGPEKIFIPSPSSRVTYSNLFHLSRERRTYNFYRGFDNSFKPSYAWSDDLGDTWQSGGIVIQVPLEVRHRPYAKYCSNNTDTIHIAYTEGHPRDFDNSIYHVMYRNGQLHRSDGTIIRSLREGLHSPEEGTRLFAGSRDAVAWTTDFHALPNGQLLLAYTVQKDTNSQDHRFRLAHWDGRTWHDHEIARAGSRLYAGEDDYTGLAAIDPNNPTTLFISTNIDPATGTSLPHREIFRGHTRDYATFTWTAVTANSSADNIRPIIPHWPGRRRAILWLRGQMRTYKDYSFEVVGLFENR